MKRLKLGTHFSGMESWGLALKTMGVRHTLTFSCDSHAPCRNLINTVFKPDNLYDCVTKCSDSSTPYVDLFCCSPPCQTFSTAGKGEGAEDLSGLTMLIRQYSFCFGFNNVGLTW